MVVLLLIVHFLLGFRRLREIDYYRDDPLVLRLLGLRKIADVSTVSRAFSQMQCEEVDKVSDLSCSLVVEGLRREKLPRLTLGTLGARERLKSGRRIPRKSLLIDRAIHGAEYIINVLQTARGIYA